MRTFEVKGFTTERGARTSALVKCAKTTTLRRVLTGAAAVLCAATVALGGGVAAAHADDSGITMSLYDYTTNQYGETVGGKQIDNVNEATYYENGYEGYYSFAAFQFQPQNNFYIDNSDFNNHVLGRGATQGIVEKKLGENNVPVFSSRVTNKTSLQKDLVYLFSDSSYAKEYTGLKAVDDDGQQNGFLSKTSKGTGYHYVFDSNQTFVSLKDDGSFDKSKGVNADEVSWPRFLPFNTRDEATYKVPKDNGQGYKFPKANYSFGMKLETNFLQPKDGVVGEEPMKFSFDGDDDVWVYVDGYLVLDIGGIHDSKTGEIDFSTGKVTVQVTSNTNGTETKETTLYQLFKDAGMSNEELAEIFEKVGDNYIFKDYSTHKLSFFYLERGAGGSNCKLDFNLQTIPEGQIEVGKTVTETNSAAFVDAEFTMKVMVSDNANMTAAEAYDGKYNLYEEGNPNPIATGKETRDGTFNLKHGQYVRLTGGGKTELKANRYYTVEETGADGYSDDYTFDVGKADLVDKDNVDVKDQIGKTVPIQIGKMQHVQVYNKFNKNGRYAVAIQKKMATGQEVSANQTFTIQVTNANGEPYTGDYLLRKIGSNEAGTKETANDKGLITLHADEEARILDLPLGAKFIVKEVKLDLNTFLNPTYSVTAGQADKNRAVVEVVHAENDTTYTATVTNSLKVQPITVNAAWKVFKQLNNHKLDANMFDFTVKAVGENTAAAAEKLGIDANGVDFTNAATGAADTKAEIRTEKALTFTKEDVDKTFTYEYDEKDALNTDYIDENNASFAFDNSKYRVALTPSYKDDAKTKLQVSVVLQKWNETKDAWENQGDSLTIDSSDAPTEPLEIVFKNSYTPLGLKVTKVSSEKLDDGSHPVLKGAAFAIYEDTSAEGENKDVYDDGDKIVNGVYSTPQLDGSAMTEAGFETDKEGIAKFYGLKPGTYFIVEKKAPAGFQLADPVKVVINAEGTFTVGDKTMPLKECLAYLTVEDEPNPALPMTGSSGSVGLGAAGVATIAVAGCWLMRRRGFDFGKLIGR